MKVTSFQDVPHYPKGMRIQTHAVLSDARRAFRRTPCFQTHAVLSDARRAFRRTPCVSTFVYSWGDRRIVFHSTSKKELTEKTAQRYETITK
jgi:hypothetical protein